MYDLTNFSLKDMSTCGAMLRQIGDGAGSMEEVADKVVRYLYEQLGDEAGKPASSLVRFFITHPYKDLDANLQEHVQKVLGGIPNDPEVSCQTLLATVGEEADWNDRRRSRFYKSLPLTEETAKRIPMYAQVSDVFGIVMNKLPNPDAEFLLELEQKTYNVFFIPDSVGSAYVPDQEKFVIPYGIRSILGFYGLLPSRNLFTVIVFSKMLIPRETTEYFKTLALNVKMAILPFDQAAVFADDKKGTLTNIPQNPLVYFRSRAASQAQLLSVQETIVAQQSEQIERVMNELRNQAEELAATNATLESQILENARLRQQAAEAAVIQERNRLSRDLHDSLTQSLYSQTLYAEAGVRQLEGGQLEAAADHLRQLRETAEQALKEMRLLIFELRPSALEAEGLVPALRARLEAVEGRTGVETDLNMDESFQLKPEMENDLYWIVQEALNNALKYADASRVTVSLSRGDQGLLLQVTDNGLGFDAVSSSAKGGIGLHSMRERAERLGGSLSIQSEIGSGTVVKVEVPVE